MTKTVEKNKTIRKSIMMPAILIFLALVLTVLAMVVITSQKTDSFDDTLRNQQQELLQKLEDDTGKYDEKSIVLSGTSLPVARDLAKKLGAELRITKDGSFARLTLPDGITILDVCADDEYLSEIPRVSIDYHVRISELYEADDGSDEQITSRPNYSVSDSSYDLQTYLDYINMQDVWNITTGGGRTIAIIDTGIDTDHPEFVGKISEYSYNVTEDKIVKDYILEDGSYDWSLVEDEQGHGTAVTGVIASSMNEGEIVGIAPWAEILVIKANCDETGLFENASDLVFGLYYAIERDVSVVNMSFGIELEDEKYNVFKEPALLAKDSDIICIASAGNNSTAALTYPAADENVFGVGALAEDSWELADYSNYGENVNLVAPGTTYTTIMGGTYGTKNGTSVSAPIVSASIALFLSQDYNQEFALVQEILYASCRDLGDLGADWYYGYGALDVAALVLEERGTVTFDMLSDELENTQQIFIRNHTLQNMPEPERLYAVFDGWYYDPQCTEEYNWYNDEFSSDLTLYAGWINEDDGIPYTYVELEDGTIEIRSYTGKRRFITIPDYIEGKPVSSIGRAAFAGNTRLRQIDLPKHLVYIHDLAFEGCASLISISIPDMVVKIGERAFYDSIRLSSVTFGVHSQLETIGEEAFSSCIKLRSFTVPKGVTQIAESAFYRSTSILSFDVQEGNQYYAAVDGTLCNADSTRLICYPYGKTEKAKIPNSVTTLGSYSFRYAKLQGIESWGSASTIENSAFAHSSIKGNLTIPAQIVEMGMNAFAQNYYILNLKFESGLKEISNYAFSECSSIQSISFSDSIQTIGNSAFKSCIKLQEVYVPKNIEIIEDKAFYGCEQLTSLSFVDDARLRSIGSLAFCATAIERVDFPVALEVIGGSAFSISSLHTVAFAEGSVLREIGDGAFQSTEISQITLPESLNYLGAWSFSNTNISEVLIPKNVSCFGGAAFAGCANLAAIEVIAENPYYKDIDGIVYTESGDSIVSYPSGNINYSYDIILGIKSVGAGAFAGSKYLNDVTIPAGNETIKSKAFYKSSVATVQIGNGLKTIEEYAFSYATYLTSVNLPEGLNSVEKMAFCGTDSLMELIIPESLSVLTKESFFGCGTRRYTLPESLTEIQAMALAENKNLQYLEIPDNVVQIGKFAFKENYDMYSVSFTENAKIPRISFGAFAYCGLTSFRVPANVSSIAQGAFEGCDKLTSFIFAANSQLPSISAYMFNGCDNLESIIFENGSALTSIQAHGFEGMIKLTTVDFGDAEITNIDNYAFRFCESLTEINLPEGVTNIGRFAFYACTALTDVSLPSTLEHIGRFAFLGADSATIYFESKTLPLYIDENWDYGIRGYYLGVEEVKDGEDWKYAILTGGGIALLEYKGNEIVLDLNLLDFGSDITNIGGKCFSYTEVTKVILPDTVVTIQAEAFYHSKLKSVTIPNSVQFIGRSAFADTPITELTFGENSHLTVIEQSAFEGTSLLAGVALPASVTTLGSAVFKNSGISYVDFAEGILITDIPEEAFAYTNISTVKIPDGVSLINHGAFRETDNLRTVEFGDAEEIRIMSNVFYHSGLEEVYIPENVTYIGEYAFIALKNLTAFEVDENNPYYTTIDGVLVGSNGHKIISMPAGRTGSYTIPASIEMIGFGAFEETALSRVEFPDDSNILTLGYRAFYKSENIKDIHIPASVVSIDFYAFANCTNLESVTFASNSSLNGIYEGAFYGCKNLSDILLPDDIIEISEFAFYGCNKLAKIPVSESSDLAGIYGYAMAYTGISGEFTVPDTLIDIGEYAFMGTKITKITISNAKEWDLRIGIGAFEDCQNVSEITLPFVGASFEDHSIGWFGYIFGAGSYEANNAYVPQALKTVTVTGEITELGEGAFNNLSNLTEINLPDSIAILGQASFSGTTAKYELKRPILGRGYSWNGHDEYVVSSTMFGGGLYGHLNIDEGITEIPYGVFGGFININEITIPDSVATIEGQAFYGCINLETIRIGSGVENIDTNAFLNCGVKNVFLSEDNPYFQIIDGIIYDNPVTRIVVAPRNLPSKVAIPEGITNIHSDMVESETVFEIILPDSLKTVSYGAFDCENLMSITLGKGLEIIEDSAFYDTPKLYFIYNNSSLNLTIGSWDNGCIALRAQTIVLANGDEIHADSLNKLEIIETEDGFVFIKKDNNYYLSAYLGDEKSITLPEIINGSTYIIDSFASSAEEICVSNGADSISTNAFDSCGAVKKFTVTDNNTKYQVYDGVLYNYSYTELLSVPQKISGDITIPGSIRYVPDRAFYGRALLENITLSDGIKSIGYETFAECRNLKSVDFPNELFGIGGRCFENCTSLVAVELPLGISGFGGGYTFYNCESLEKVVLPEGLTQIGDHDFSGCSPALKVYVPSTIEYIGQHWSGFSNQLVLPENVRCIDGIIYDKSLTKIVYIPSDVNGRVVIPNGITSIPTAAFQYSKITEIVIPESVTFIGAQAFNYCPLLKNVYLNAKITDIGEYTFSRCSSLTSITIPEGVERIGSYAFSGCSELKEIHLPDTVTNISDGAFSYCDKLEVINLPNSIEYIGSNAITSVPGLELIVDEQHPCITKYDGVFYIKFSEYMSVLYVPGDISGNIVVPDGVTEINSSFAFCSKITSITLPDSMNQNYGYISFYGCESLTELIVSDSHPSYTSINGALYNKEKTEMLLAPYGCETLEFAEGVTKIGSIRCGSNLHTIILPSTMKQIDDSAFMGVDGIEVIYNNSSLPITLGSYDYGWIALYAKVLVEADGTRRYADGVTDYETFTTEDGFNWKKENGKYYLTGYSGFQDTITLPTSINGNEYSLYLFDGASHVIIPEGWTLIPANAFSGNKSLQSISMPNTIKVIGESAFYECHNLKSITLHEGIERIESSGFGGCIGLSEVKFPSSLSYIGSGAFYNCSFESINIPATIKEFGYGVFSSCKKLTTVILEEGLTQLPGFIWCTALTEISIPDSVTDIGSFEECTALAEIFIPAGVTSIDSLSFYNCTSLATITGGDNIAYINEGAFYNTAYYNNKDNWDQGVLYLNKCLLAVEEDVKYFDLKKGVKCIAVDAYSNCYMLKIAYVSNNLEESILRSATNLETLVILEEMPDGVCDYFGGGLSSIPMTLQNIVIGKGVKMKNYAFGSEWEGWLTGVKIFVEDTEKNTMWDDNYPYWQKDNKVYYENKWIYSSFYDENGSLVSKTTVPNSQVVRIPWTDSYYDDTYAYIFQGYDIDGDGISDSIPATSSIDISAYAVYKKLNICDIKGHNAVVDAAVNATCTETGLTEGSHCDRCGETLVAQDILSKLGHNTVIDVAVDATCTETGLTEGSHCDRCGETLVAQTQLPLSSHTYDNDEDNGCNVCGFIREVICNHKELTSYVKEPTCTEQGYTTYTCNCGYSYIGDYVDANGHEWDGGRITKEPTETETGIRIYCCTVCESTRTEDVPKLEQVVGDINGNNGIDSDDAVYLLMHIYFPDQYPVNQNCDVNNDNTITSDDAIYLLMHTFFPDQYPLTQSGNEVAVLTFKKKED